MRPLAALILVVTTTGAFGQCTIGGDAQVIHFKGTADTGTVYTTDVPFARISTSCSGGAPAKVTYKLDHIDFGIAPPTAPFSPTVPPPFLVVSPSSVTATGGVLTLVPEGVRSDVLKQLSPGEYTANAVFTTIDQTPPSTAGSTIELLLDFPSVPAIDSVTSTASFRPEIAPRELVSIFGKNLGPFPVSSTFDSTGVFPSTLGSTTVTFNGVAAPVLYASQTQINTVVPYAVSGQSPVQVVVTHYGQASTAMPVLIQQTAPALFTATQNGTGQGAVLNFDSGSGAVSMNGLDNPATVGSLVETFATGAGIWNPALPDGSVSLVPLSFTAQPVSLTIGGKTATIYYAGAAPYLVSGTLQINAYVPQVPSGPQPVVLKIGQNDNSQQNVTIAIK